LAEELVPQKKQGETWGSPVSSPFLGMTYVTLNICSSHFRQRGIIQALCIYISRSAWLISTGRREGRCLPSTLLLYLRD